MYAYNSIFAVMFLIELSAKKNSKDIKRLKWIISGISSEKKYKLDYLKCLYRCRKYLIN
jgi:hypothetical protein